MAWYQNSSKHPEEYLRKALQSGYTDKNVSWLHYTGVRPKDIYDAAQKGYNPQSYGIARDLGISHDEYGQRKAELSQFTTKKDMSEHLDHPYHAIINSGIHHVDYNSLKNIGATDQEVLDAVYSGMDIDAYVKARKKNIPHSDLKEANTNGLSLNTYVSGRESNIGHKEMLDANDKYKQLFGYVHARISGSTPKEINEAHSQGIPLKQYASSIKNGRANHKDVLEAHKAGADIDTYGYLRFNNIPHEDAVRMLVPDYNPYLGFFTSARNSTVSSKLENTIQDMKIVCQHRKQWHYFAARDNGATHDQFMEAFKKPSININDYVWGLRGAKHKELMDVNDKGYKLQGYSIARNAGLTHNKTMGLLNEKFPVTKYIEAYRAGATDSEIRDARNNKINLSNYASFRSNGSTHKEAKDLANKGIDAWGYRRLVNVGANKNEILDVLNNNVAVFPYVKARETNATHDEIMDAWNNNLPLNTYAFLRSNRDHRYFDPFPGYSHQEVMEMNDSGLDFDAFQHKIVTEHKNPEIARRELQPNYNPYNKFFTSSRHWYV